MRYSKLPCGTSIRSSARCTGTRGWTLVEMLVVVVILGLGAAVVMPSMAPASAQRLDFASTSVGDAMRFARDQSRLTSVIHGVNVDVSNNRLRVFRLDQSVNPNVPIFDVYHPVTKQPYVLQFDSAPFERVSIGSLVGNWIGSCSQTENIAFGAEGTTICTEPLSARIENAQIDVGFDGISASVLVDRFTGRVTTP